MRNRTLTALVGAALFASTLPAQITYVDADCSVNTTLADGTAYAPMLNSTAIDNIWNQRAFANGGSILSSHDVTGNEDCPMLRTTLSGLIPGFPYLIYTYWWGTAATSWRGRALVDTVQPSPPLPGYVALWFSTSVFAPMTPLAFDAPLGTNQTALGLTYDASGFENSGHFANQVLIQEGNRWLFEVPLGVFTADGNGEIQVYIDDLEGQQGSGNRTWYDGVGYEWAPLPVGSGCGNPAPAIGFTGQPIMTRDFSLTLAGGPPSSLALLTVGFNDTSWNGLPLPLSLAPFGYPGCALNVAADVNLFLLTDANGEASYTINIAGVPSLDLYWQWAALVPPGLATTTGLSTHFHR
ncbi:MAG: hypothetical protein U1E73_06345 [Planctomycetota bacterium]